MLACLTALVAAEPVRAQGALHPDCRWSKGMRADPTRECPGDPVLPVELPRYDVEAACRRQNFNPSTCVEYVQPYYDQLKEVWLHLDEDLKRRCTEKYRENIHARYVQIHACIDAELTRREHQDKQHNPTRFRY